MENEKVSKKIESWAKAMEKINKVTKELNEKPALIVYRTDSNDFRGFLNQKALRIVEKIVKGAKYFWLDVCYFDGENHYFIDLMMSKEYQSHAVRDNTPPSEPGSHTSYRYHEIKDAQFNINRISGEKLFGEYYFGPSFRFFFLCEDLLKTSKEQKALYFKS